MTAEQVVLAVAGTIAIAASMVALVVTRPRPRSILDSLYLMIPVAGVIALVGAVRAAL
jgi:hypothetical protein